VDTVGLEIDARYNGLDVRKVAPELGKDNSRIDLIKLFDRDKGVKNANTRQIEARKKVVGDPGTCRVSLFLRKHLLFFKILLAKFSLVH
jgi:hypothetical protein